MPCLRFRLRLRRCRCFFCSTRACRRCAEARSSLRSFRCDVVFLRHDALIHARVANVVVGILSRDVLGIGGGTFVCNLPCLCHSLLPLCLLLRARRRRSRRLRSTLCGLCCLGGCSRGGGVVRRCVRRRRGDSLAPRFRGGRRRCRLRRRVRCVPSGHRSCLRHRCCGGTVGLGSLVSLVSAWARRCRLRSLLDALVLLRCRVVVGSRCHRRCFRLRGSILCTLCWPLALRSLRLGRLWLLQRCCRCRCRCRCLLRALLAAAFRRRGCGSGSILLLSLDYDRRRSGGGVSVGLCFDRLSLRRRRALSFPCRLPALSRRRLRCSGGGSDNVSRRLGLSFRGVRHYCFFRGQLLLVLRGSGVAHSSSGSSGLLLPRFSVAASLCNGSFCGFVGVIVLVCVHSFI
eukprot:Rhum_TRINITY_DN6639_c0_g1::Rhum_TRINITY_DN6639_c0_g1_i1::g.20647::m.20647